MPSDIDLWDIFHRIPPIISQYWFSYNGLVPSGNKPLPGSMLTPDFYKSMQSLGCNEVNLWAQWTSLKQIMELRVTVSCSLGLMWCYHNTSQFSMQVMTSNLKNINVSLIHNNWKCMGVSLSLRLLMLGCYSTRPSGFTMLTQYSLYSVSVSLNKKHLHKINRFSLVQQWLQQSLSPVCATGPRLVTLTQDQWAALISS